MRHLTGLLLAGLIAGCAGGPGDPTARAGVAPDTSGYVARGRPAAAWDPPPADTTGYMLPAVPDTTRFPFR